MAQPLPAVTTGMQQITALLVQANIAIPIVLGVATSVIGIIQALKGTPPPLNEIIADIERQVEANRLRGEAEIARLRALASVSEAAHRP